MKLYKKSFKGIALAAFSVLALSACSDWTDSESIKTERTRNRRTVSRTVCQVSEELAGIQEF